MNQDTLSTYKNNASICLAIVAGISLFASIGWLTTTPILASLGAENIPMAPVTALFFLVLCILWLVQRVSNNRPVISAFVRATLVGMFVLVLILGFRYLTGLGPDLQKLFFPNPPLFGQVSSGRMSPLTALGFCLTIPAYFLLVRPEPNMSRRSVSAILSLVVFTLSGINCLGYLLGSPFFYGGTFIPVALTTALSFLFLSIFILFTAGPACWPMRMFVGNSIKARLMRTFIPASIIIVIVQGYLSTSHDLVSVNPALRVTVAVILASVISVLIIFYISHTISAEVDRGNQARLKAENTLKQSEMRFRMLFEQAAVGVALIDTKTGHYLDINKKYCDFLGYTKEEMINLSFQDVTDPDYVQENIDNNALLFAGKLREFAIEKRYIRKNGEKVWGELTVSPLWKEGEDSSDFVHIAVVQDITARKQAEEALRGSEERFKKLFKEAPMGIALVDSMTGRSYEVNPKYANIAGRTVEDVLAIDWMSITHPDDLQKDLENMALLNSGKIPGFQMEKRYLHPDGSTVWIKMTVAPIYVDDKAHLRHLCMIEDITERKRSELIENATFRISQAAMTSDGLDAFYVSIHAIMRELLPAENFFIALYDPSNELVSFPYYIDQYDVQPSEPERSKGLTGYVIKTGRSLWASREVYDRLIQQGEVEAEGTPSVDWLGVPLKTDGHIIGIMAVQSYTKGIHFQETDLHLLEFISTQVTQAIERKRLEEEIHNLSLMDELTGLHNRRGFNLLAEQELKLAQREKKAMLLFFGDVDNLKRINDTLGHAYGDLALKEVSIILKENFRNVDILARIGGDEFVALALDVSLEAAQILTDRIQEALDERNQDENKAFDLSLSIGITRYDPNNPCTLSELISQADSQMYLQKQIKKELRNTATQ